MNRILLGIDPGLATTGFGLIEEIGRKLRYVDCGYIHTDKDLPLHQRLDIISKSMQSIIKKYQPELVAIESLFFAKNRTTAMVVAQARGVILSNIAKYNISVVEYTPLQVKQMVTGYGRADKKQMQKMIKLLLNLESAPKLDDAADALALAICAATSRPVLK